jgi:Tol biopolymer transport system component
MIRKCLPLGVLACFAAALVFPALSQATLVFTRNPLKPMVYVAKNNGSVARKVGAGSNPRISPDGKTVAFYRFGEGKQPSQLMIAPASGGAPKQLATGWQEPFLFAWSPDSSRVVVELGPEVGKRRLVAIDVATGVQQTVASGYFWGVSFAPQDSEQLAFAMSSSERFPPRSDIYKIDLLPPGAVSVAAVKPQRLTNDHRSTSPLWGPNEQIVFVKHLGEKSRKYGPKNDLFLMKEDGSRIKRLTHTKVGPLLSGLSPTAWSGNGRRLLTEFGGQDTTYAVTVNPRTGAERALTKERETGFVGTALSTDGKVVLGSLGGFEPGPGHKVVSIPYTGGRPKVLADNASEPDWNR